MLFSTGSRPNSPYTIQFGVVLFKWSKSLQNFNCTRSNISLLPNLHTSQPYNKIGFTSLSKRPSWQLIDKLCFLPFAITSYIALIAFSDWCFFTCFEWTRSRKIYTKIIKIFNYFNVLPIIFKLKINRHSPLRKKSLSSFYLHLLSFSK